AAIVSLGNLGPNESKVVESVCHLLKDKNEMVHRSTVWTLNQMMTPDSKPLTTQLFLELIDDKDEYVRYNALKALSSQKPPVPQLTNILQNAVDKDYSVSVRAMALSYLTQKQIELRLRPQTPPAIAVRGWSADEAKEFQQFDSLMEGIDFEEDIFKSLASLIEKGRSRQIAAEISERLKSRDVSELWRYEWIVILGDLRVDERAIDRLQQKRKNPEMWLARRAIWTLGNVNRSHAERVAPELIASMSHSDPRIRLEALDALVQLRWEHSTVHEAFRVALKDDDVRVRRNAIRVLSTSHLAGEMLPDLIQTCQDPDSVVRYWGSIALARQYPENAKATEALKTLCNDSTPFVRSNAQLFLPGIAKNKFLE
ncbi:MAG: HEAT repeat domain-containing protein, partial [Planctomycetaceae bacterium]|nr:HEAT repeat domain-containing protein [Planctomycetaceae bacterium]